MRGLIAVGIAAALTGAGTASAVSAKPPAGALFGVHMGDTKAQVRVKWKGHYRVCRRPSHCGLGSLVYVDRHGTPLGVVSFDRTGRVITLWKFAPAAI
jgi:hypothetical protein